MKQPIRRCAIYTRKSSDEGLDQSFNSLDAQREAGEAYVKSQGSEGWRAMPELYDDGGYSGGTMERPALRRLLADIETGLVDVVVVYKIDRLTRSLADFARIVERFDAHDVSFVSVTQAFNTTNSMGRLTLNVLLSFAQFEREVTGERIRDKIAASKAKGMWMGGIAPLGYDLPAVGTRKLLVNRSEALIVRRIYARYLEIGSVHQLASELEKQGVKSKQRVTASGKILGGLPFSRGALFHLLRNRLYLGKITHKGAIHEGEHDAIIDAVTFDDVQNLLDSRARRQRARQERRVEQALLTGRIFDNRGEIMSPAFSRGRGGRVYRYYVSASVQQGTAAKRGDAVRRVPAPAIEAFVDGTLKRLLAFEDNALSRLEAVRLMRDGIVLELPTTFSARIRENLAADDVYNSDDGSCAVTVPMHFPLRGGRRSIEFGDPKQAVPDPILVAALRKAHGMVLRDAAGMPTIETAPKSPYERKILRLAFLAPDLQRDILAGRQPHGMNLEALMHAEIPLMWAEQRRFFPPRA